MMKPSIVPDCLRVERPDTSSIKEVLGCFVLVGVLVFGASASVAAERNYDQRISKIERLLENQNLLELLMQMQSLQKEVSRLRGEFELLAHNFGGMKQQQKDIYLDLDQRMLDLEKRLSANVQVPSELDILSGGSLQDSVASEQTALTEQEKYQSALAILKDGRYEAAIEAFKLYLASYPASIYAANAQYWMAEAYYVLKDYDIAVMEFGRVASMYPESRKVADAHLKMGFSYYEMKRWADARKALEKILMDFAGSTAARLAKHRLQKMKQERRG